ncbi:NTP transferase domain-containing protein [Cucumibacter marinus]|uniref:NTP transferase domain-containing protein n=1 Tax=Cucumibacter marinus TaxID=1121252 RepID=UPI00138B11C3|nr:NTP transferase domain-containing protein [Cucumibacter marinus]
MPDAILLAAGRGTRMGALSDQRPKPLTPVAGQPVLDRIAANLAAEGITRFTVTAHHLAAQITSHIEAVAASHPDLAFEVSVESELLGVGGGIRHALPNTSSDPVLIANTDAFWPAGSDRPVARMTTVSRDGPVLLCAEPARAVGHRGAHDFVLDTNARLSREGRGKPVIYAGMMLAPRAFLMALPQGYGPITPLLDQALAEHSLHGVMLEAPWLHIGDPEAIVEAEQCLVRGRG